jgi:hypothetical protein
VSFEGPGFLKLQAAQEVSPQQLMGFGGVHRSTPISSRIVRSARTA